MKIQIQQRGGFAGVAYTLVDLDSASAEPSQAAEIERLAHQVEDAAATRARAGAATGADFLTYDITLQEGDRHRTLTLVDDDSPSMVHVRAVLEQLSWLGRGSH
jgi:hypothetical protein